MCQRARREDASKGASKDARKDARNAILGLRHFAGTMPELAVGSAPPRASPPDVTIDQSRVSLVYVHARKARQHPTPVERS